MTTKVNSIETQCVKISDHKSFEEKLNKAVSKDEFKTTISEFPKKNDVYEDSYDKSRKLSLSEIVQIEWWTQFSCGNVLFDSDKDDWNGTNSVFGDRIIFKSNLIFVIEDTNGNKFGGYMFSSINLYNSWIKDPNSFVFSLKSNGKFNEMKKFNIKSNSQNAFCLDRKDLNQFLFVFGLLNKLFHQNLFE